MAAMKGSESTITSGPMASGWAALQGQRHKAAQAVAHDGGLAQLLGFDVGQQLVAHGGQQRVGQGGDGSRAGEACQRDDMAPVPRLVVGHGFVPHRAGAVQTGNEQHGLALAHHPHREGGVQRRIIGHDFCGRRGDRIGGESSAGRAQQQQRQGQAAGESSSFHRVSMGLLVIE
jgi:hypothetical protein